jgi:hypothetical protein
MRTKLIFENSGLLVWETDNKDVRGKEWHITDGSHGCSIGFKPEFDAQWIKQYLAEYLREMRDSAEVDEGVIVPVD